MIAAVLLAVAGGGAWLWTRGDAGTADEGARGRRSGVVAVESAAVRRATLRDLRSFSGTLQAQARFAVAPKVSGRLERLAVDIGDRVSNGQVVARLDDGEAIQQVDQVRAELGVARAGVAEARSLMAVKQRQLERMQQLHERRIASETELETAQVEAEAQRARVQVTRAQVTQREAALKAAEVRLSYTVIRASWSEGDGTRVVGERFANEGDLVPANQSILTVLDLATLTAVVHAAERDYPGLRLGLAAVVTADAFPDRRFAGQLVRLAPIFKEASRQARVEVRVANAELVLKPGMFATVVVEVGRVEDATAVPLEAVVTRDGRVGVFLADPARNVARFVPVRTGIADKGLVQVVEPALDGRVITLGNHLLGDGTAINMVDAPGGVAEPGGVAKPDDERKRGGAAKPDRAANPAADGGRKRGETDQRKAAS